MPFFQIRDDITHLHVQAIVNPANEMLLEGDGTSRAIYRAAGEDGLSQVCHKIGRCAVGEAVITDGFKLCEKIIHATGPIWKNGKEQETEILRNTYLSCFRLCEENDIESVAFPILSSGNYGFPKLIAIETAAMTITEYLKDHEMTVYLVFYDEESLKIGKEFFKELIENIDDEYIAKNDEMVPYGQTERMIREEFARRNPRDLFENRILSVNMLTDASSEEEFSIGARPKGRVSKRKRQIEENKEMVFEGVMPLANINEMMKRKNESFSEMVLRIIDEHGWKDTDVYKRAGMDRKLFSKIRSDKNYAPSRKVALLLCIALRLNIDQARDLLMKGGYAFSDTSKSDLIIRLHIENGIYDLMEINMMLMEYGVPVLTTK